MSLAAPSGIWKSAWSLCVVAIIGTGLLAIVNQVTAERILEQERLVILRQLGQIIPDAHDNSMLDDRFRFTDETYFPGGQEVVTYRARLRGEPTAVVLRFAAMNGYNGRIDLLAGINFDGTLRGVRVISHKETPGLGDGIEIEKSAWIRDFDSKSLINPGMDGWTVRRDGGEFDQFTGATITPRAVILAVKRALQYFELNRDSLFDTPADPVEERGRH